MIDAGKVQSLAVMASERNPAFKDVPTLKEAAGIDYSVGAWRGIAGPKGLPKEIADKLTAELKKASDFEGVHRLHGQPRLRHEVGRRRRLHELHGRGRRQDEGGDDRGGSREEGLTPRMSRSAASLKQLETSCSSPTKSPASMLVGLGAAAAYGGSLLPPVPGQQVGPNVFPMVVGAGLCSAAA